MKSVCLAILNYNGRKHLEALLPSAVVAANNYTGKCSILVLDNRSTDPDVQWIKKTYPLVRIEEAPENDFLFSYNWLLPRLKEEVVVILNNDLRVDPDFIRPLEKHFDSPDVFAVSASSYDWEGHEKTIGPARLTYNNGFYGWSFDQDRQELCHTLFASGGFMAVDREKFVELGGFNRLYHPAYCEDLDLGFRAWRHGWRSIYEPRSIVWHRESASWSVSPKSRPYKLNLRNSLLFQWSSLPMSQDRSKRYWSTLKLIIIGILRNDYLWMSILVSTWTHWLLVRHHYSNHKVSPNEVRKIMTTINQPLPL
jgi:GT2 family glycosyltransferase